MFSTVATVTEMGSLEARGIWSTQSEYTNSVDYGWDAPVYNTRMLVRSIQWESQSYGISLRDPDAYELFEQSMFDSLLSSSLAAHPEDGVDKQETLDEYMSRRYALFGALNQKDPNILARVKFLPQTSMVNYDYIVAPAESHLTDQRTVAPMTIGGDAWPLAKMHWTGDYAVSRHGASNRTISMYDERWDNFADIKFTDLINNLVNFREDGQWESTEGVEQLFGKQPSSWNDLIDSSREFDMSKLDEFQDEVQTEFAFDPDFDEITLKRLTRLPYDETRIRAATELEAIDQENRDLDRAFQRYTELAQEVDSDEDITNAKRGVALSRLDSCLRILRDRRARNSRWIGAMYLAIRDSEDVLQQIEPDQGYEQLPGIYKLEDTRRRYAALRANETKVSEAYFKDMSSRFDDALRRYEIEAERESENALRSSSPIQIENLGQVMDDAETELEVIKDDIRYAEDNVKASSIEEAEKRESLVSRIAVSDSRYTRIQSELGYLQSDPAQSERVAQLRRYDSISHILREYRESYLPSLYVLDESRRTYARFTEVLEEIKVYIPNPIRAVYARLIEYERAIMAIFERKTDRDFAKISSIKAELEAIVLEESDNRYVAHQTVQCRGYIKWLLEDIDTWIGAFHERKASLEGTLEGQRIEMIERLDEAIEALRQRIAEEGAAADKADTQARDTASKSKKARSRGSRESSEESESEKQEESAEAIARLEFIASMARSRANLASQIITELEGVRDKIAATPDTFEAVSAAAKEAKSALESPKKLDHLASVERALLKADQATREIRDAALFVLFNILNLNQLVIESISRKLKPPEILALSQDEHLKSYREMLVNRLRGAYEARRTELLKAGDRSRLMRSRVEGRLKEEKIQYDRNLDLYLKDGLASDEAIKKVQDLIDIVQSEDDEKSGVLKNQSDALSEKLAFGKLQDLDIFDAISTATAIDREKEKIVQAEEELRYARRVRASIRSGYQDLKGKIEEKKRKIDETKRRKTVALNREKIIDTSSWPESLTRLAIDAARASVDEFSSDQSVEGVLSRLVQSLEPLLELKDKSLVKDYNKAMTAVDGMSVSGASREQMKVYRALAKISIVDDAIARINASLGTFEESFQPLFRYFEAVVRDWRSSSLSFDDLLDQIERVLYSQRGVLNTRMSLVAFRKFLFDRRRESEAQKGTPADPQRFKNFLAKVKTNFDVDKGLLARIPEPIVSPILIELVQRKDGGREDLRRVALDIQNDWTSSGEARLFITRDVTRVDNLVEALTSKLKAEIKEFNEKDDQFIRMATHFGAIQASMFMSEFNARIAMIMALFGVIDLSGVGIYVPLKQELPEDEKRFSSRYIQPHKSLKWDDLILASDGYEILRALMIVNGLARPSGIQELRFSRSSTVIPSLLVDFAGPRAASAVSKDIFSQSMILAGSSKEVISKILKGASPEDPLFVLFLWCETFYAERTQPFEVPEGGFKRTASTSSTLFGFLIKGAPSEVYMKRLLAGMAYRGMTTPKTIPVSKPIFFGARPGDPKRIYPFTRQGLLDMVNDGIDPPIDIVAARPFRRHKSSVVAFAMRDSYQILVGSRIESTNQPTAMGRYAGEGVPPQWASAYTLTPATYSYRIQIAPFFKKTVHVFPDMFLHKTKKSGQTVQIIPPAVIKASARSEKGLENITDHGSVIAFLARNFKSRAITMQGNCENLPGAANFINPSEDLFDGAVNLRACLPTTYFPNVICGLATHLAYPEIGDDQGLVMGNDAFSQHYTYVGAHAARNGGIPHPPNRWKKDYKFILQ